jgi:hypothetical protein
MKKMNHTREYYEKYLNEKNLTYSDMVVYIKLFNGRALESREVMNYLVFKNFSKKELDFITSLRG